MEGNLNIMYALKIWSRDKTPAENSRELETKQFSCDQQLRVSHLHIAIL